MNNFIDKDKQLIFVVEDNDAYRVLLGSLLENNGFLVMLFENGRKAVDMLHCVQPNLIVTDINMPYMDGFELGNYVGETFGLTKIPLVYISTDSSNRFIHKAKMLGVSKFLEKPIEPFTLLDTIDCVLKKAV